MASNVARSVIEQRLGQNGQNFATEPLEVGEASLPHEINDFRDLLLVCGGGDEDRQTGFLPETTITETIIAPVTINL